MNTILNDFTQQALNEYREVYKIFMGYTDEQMPTNNVLLFVALTNDKHDMLNRLDEKKGESL